MSIDVLVAVTMYCPASCTGMARPLRPRRCRRSHHTCFCPNIGSSSLAVAKDLGSTWSWTRPGMGGNVETRLDLAAVQVIGSQDTSYAIPSHGFAITEEGECQVVVSAFNRVGA